MDEMSWMKEGTALRVARATAVVVLALAPIVPARAGDTGAGCGAASYNRTASCRLLFRGFPITVFGDAQASGTASVRVWVTIEEAGDVSPVVLECTGRASGYTSCARGLPDDTTKIDHNLAQQFHLHCWVSSNGTGAYRCVSGSGV